MAESRTQKSLKNAQVALIFYFIQLLLGFFSRKAFFDYLGSELLGLNTTASNLLGFLNLAELGVSAAVGYFLYQPLYDKDYVKLNKLVSIQGWIYRKIAFLIIGASIILMMFFPMIFKKSPLPIWYAYCTFGVLLFSAMLGYFFNYRQIVLYADQKNYKIQQNVQGSTIIKTILQILAISFLPFPFFGWLILEVIGSISTTLILNAVLRKEYPWLKTEIKDGKKYIKEYPEILKKTGQAFFHRIGGVILSQSSPLIIYGFTSLSVVALYGNYVLIITKVTQLLASLFNSTSAAIGNLIASKDDKRIIKVFWELYDSRLFFSTVVLLSLYYLTNPLITIWLGKSYCLDKTFLLLYIIMNSVTMTRTTVDNYISALGLFSDIWSPIAEAFINISSSIILGYYFGLKGVIVGISISLIIIILIWKPYFLFKKGLKINPLNYFYRIILRYILVALLFISTNSIFRITQLDIIENIKDLIYNGIIICICNLLCTFLIYIILLPGLRDFTQRCVYIIRQKTQYNNK